MMALQLLARSSSGALKKLSARCLNVSLVTNKIFEIQKEDEFSKNVLSAEKPVVVDFYADWCGPCRTLTPQLQEVVEKFEDEVDLVKVNVDHFPDLAMTYEVTSIPAVHAFTGGIKKSSFVGAKDKEFLTDFVQGLIDT